jgi:protein ImuB
MFACLYLPPPAKPGTDRGKGQGVTIDDGRSTIDDRRSTIVTLARDFSPRIETRGDRVVTLDISGLGSLLGDARSIGEQLRRNAADAGLRLHIAVAATSTAAILLAHARAGLTVVPEGAEAAALAPLPLRLLSQFDSSLKTQGSGSEARSGQKLRPQSPKPEIDQFHRWGLRTLGELAAIPAADLSERLGPGGLLWQRWARGEDARPLVPAAVEERFEESLDLEWPIENLEPLSFVLARLFDPLCERLERRDRGAVSLQVRLTLVTREVHARSVQLPAPMRDARVLRTLALLDLETNPPRAAIDRVTVAVEVTEGRVLQFGMFARALPAEKLATLIARLGALMGCDRIGAPRLVDSYRPGAFAMTDFQPLADRESLRASGRSSASGGGAPRAVKNAETVSQVIRRFRMPIPARVTLEQGRPVRVSTDRRGFSGGKVERCEGPWRSSGDWWLTGVLPLAPCSSPLAPRSTHAHAPWDCDEWDVVLSDGVSYRISQARKNSAWFVNGMLD